MGQGKAAGWRIKEVGRGEPAIFYLPFRRIERSVGWGGGGSA